jgi:hypothetical protein
MCIFKTFVRPYRGALRECYYNPDRTIFSDPTEISGCICCWDSRVTYPIERGVEKEIISCLKQTALMYASG